MLRARRTALLAAAVAFGLVAIGDARAGHELAFYPSFYPQEITLKVTDATAAARGLEKSELQAYVGDDPFAGRTPPEHVRYVESLGGLVTLAFAPATPGADDATARCAAGALVRAALAAAPVDGFVASAYPVTPFHPDWLVHFDRAPREPAAAPPASAGLDAGRAHALTVKAPARFAQVLTRAGVAVSDTRVDATVEIADTRGLVEESPAPWAKDGWYQTVLLYAGGESGAARQAVDTAIARRERGQYASAAERAELERTIVADVLRDCTRVPLGYLVRREAYSAEYSNGVENVAWDSEAGLRSAIFLRTVKLKDFMWNGWLALGVPGDHAAAWNPAGGFTDPMGRLLWAAVGDLPALPSPYGAGAVANRVETQDVRTGPVVIPGDALAPDRTTGALHRVGAGQRATAKVTYRVRFSKFHDGTKMSAADVLAPYAFAVRWAARDPDVARATALARERFAAARVVRVDTDIRDLGDLHVFYDVAVVEVYLRGEGGAADAAAIAPPWSTVPWQLRALMGEAVGRGWAALSEREARRRRVAWLDLARDARLGTRLATLTADFERRGFVPDALAAVVTAQQARTRWAALRRFAREHGHYLVTNGPYRLDKVTRDTVVLVVFRDFSYPLGVGAFDRWTLPLRAYVTNVETTSQGLAVTADVERIEKFARSYKILRGPFHAAPAGEGFKPVPPVVHWVVLGADGHLRAVGTSDRVDGDKLVVPLGGLERGEYRVALAVTLGDNLVKPEVKVTTWTRS